MNKFYKLLFLIPIIIVGCKNTDINNKKFSQVIDNFDMNIYSIKGEKILSIKSPSSRYENSSNIINLDETTINLFKNNQTEYIINSNKSKLSDNKVLELNGNVIVKNTAQDADNLYANNFTWDIRNTKYLLLGDVEFENNNIYLSSNKAILNKANNVIEFFNPVKYKIKDSNNEGGYEINSENAFYNINTKSVSFTSSEKKVRSKIYF